MKVSLSKSQLSGKVEAPPSKSYSIRALLCAVLSPGTSYVRFALDAEDTRATIDAINRLGGSAIPARLGWKVHGGEMKAPASDIFCRDSAANLRFLIAITATLPGQTRLVASEQLARRPVGPLLSALAQIGVSTRQDGTAIVVHGGEIAGGEVTLPGDISSQFISALMLMAPRCSHGLKILLNRPPRSQSYLEMTMACLKDFGIRVKAAPTMTTFSIPHQQYISTSYDVEGDWSQAAFLLALGAMAGEVLITNLNAESLQGDHKILSLLQKMGARFSMRRSSVLISKGRLRGISADLSDCIDLLPVMAVLAAVAEGPSFFTGIGTARLKESDRVAAVIQELAKTGIRSIEEPDGLRIIGGFPHGATIDSHTDHRIAMAFGILGAAVGNIVVDGAECVSKTYPDFWKVIGTLQGKVEIDVE